MRLLSCNIDGYFNLKRFRIDFDVEGMTTVLLGPNGSGKSYLLEAIALIFRNIDLDESPPPFTFDLKYKIDRCEVILSGQGNEWGLYVDGKSLSRSAFRESKFDLLPDTIFAYYSGDNDRLENIF